MRRIAVVEDNPDNMLLVQAILEDRYEISGYETGFDAVEGFKISVPDLILLDISLPGMNGIEVLSHIRGDDMLKELPVICLTAHAMTGDREKYLSFGFDDYITKPILDEDELISLIEQHLEGNQH